MDLFLFYFVATSKNPSGFFKGILQVVKLVYDYKNFNLIELIIKKS